MTKFISYPFFHDNVPVDISFVFAEERPAGKHGPLQLLGRETCGSEDILRQIGTPCVQDTAFAVGIFRVFGSEELIRFDRHIDRYVKLEILATCGAASKRSPFKNATVVIGELTPFNSQAEWTFLKELPQNA